MEQELRSALLKNELVILVKNFGTESFKDIIFLLINEQYLIYIG